MQFALVAAAWLFLISAVFWSSRNARGGSVGLTFAYACLFSVIHFGAALYVLPWYDPSQHWYLVVTKVSRSTVGAGFVMSLLGLGGFYLGVRLHDMLGFATGNKRKCPLSTTEARRYARNLIVVGAVFYVAIFRLADYIPSGRAITGAGIHLVSVGVGLGALVVLNSKMSVSKVTTAGLIIGIPFATMVSMGFLSYGVNAVVVICAFLAPFVRVRRAHVMFVVPVFWFALSFYVTYMAARTELRHVVWGGEDFGARIGKVAAVFLGEFEVFSIFNNEHLYRIDSRLNQNSFVGLAIEKTGEHGTPFAGGRTIVFAAVAWIPRAVWPNKPKFGGSGAMVSEHTGLVLSKSTSFGAGQVLEFYVNFGTAGVVIGFVVLGFALRHVDMRAASELRRGRLSRFAGFFLIGACMLQPQGILAEIVASAAAGILLMIAMTRISPGATGQRKSSGGTPRAGVAGIPA